MFNENMLIREWLNGSLVPLTINLALIIGIYIMQCIVDARRCNRSWRKVPGIRTACALFWVFSAESIRATFVWLTLRTQNNGHALPAWFADVSNVMLVIGAGVLVAAVLRCTYIFTPVLVRNVFWVYSLTVTILFIVISQVFPGFPPIN